MALAGFAEAEKEIAEKFNTDFSNKRPDVSIFWENDRQDPSAESAYVRFFVNSGEDSNSIGSQGGVGKNRYRQSGTVTVAVYGKSGVRTHPIQQIADDAADVLRGLNVSEVQFRGIRNTKAGVTEDGAWFRVNVRAPFEYDIIQ